VLNDRIFFIAATDNIRPWTQRRLLCPPRFFFPSYFAKVCFVYNIDATGLRACVFPSLSKPYTSLSFFFLDDRENIAQRDLDRRLLKGFSWVFFGLVNFAQEAGVASPFKLAQLGIIETLLPVPGQSTKGVFFVEVLNCVF